jgi:hypothetical protein
VDPLAALTGVPLAHGGTAGLVVEIASALAIVALGLAYWVGQRHKDSEEVGGTSRFPKTPSTGPRSRTGRSAAGQRHKDSNGEG